MYIFFFFFPFRFGRHLPSFLIRVTFENKDFMAKASINQQKTLNRQESVLMALPQGPSDNSLYWSIW